MAITDLKYNNNNYNNKQYFSFPLMTIRAHKRDMFVLI